MTTTSPHLYIVNATAIGEDLLFEDADTAKAVAEAVGADAPSEARLINRREADALIQEHFEAYNGYAPPPARVPLRDAPPSAGATVGVQQLDPARAALLEQRTGVGVEHLRHATAALQGEHPAATRALREIADDPEVYAPANASAAVYAIGAIAREHNLALPPLELADHPGVNATRSVVAARDALARGDVSGAIAHLPAAASAAHLAGAAQLGKELDGFFEDIDPRGREDDSLGLRELLSAAVADDVPDRAASVLLAELDDIARRHGVHLEALDRAGDVQPADLDAEQLLELRLERLQSGGRLTLGYGTQIAADERGYSVDGLHVGQDADVAAITATSRDSARASASARGAHDVAAMCQPRPTREATAARPAGAGASTACSQARIDADRGEAR